MGYDEHGPAYPEAPSTPEELDAKARFWGLFGLASCFALIVTILVWSCLPARAMNHGFNPDAPTVKWMEKQIRPDSPPNSCCGAADGYPVDNYEPLPDGTYRVWIANGDPIVFPDGTRRDPWDISIPLVVPKEKINAETDDLDNPTDHGWLFFRPSNDHEPGSFYCFIRHPTGG